MMSMMINMSLSLHALSDGFSPQEVRILIFTDRMSAFLQAGKQQTPFFMDLVYSKNRQAVILLD